MQSLGDLLPDSFKTANAENNIHIGSVIRCHASFTKPPKQKRFIIIGFDSSDSFIGVVLINSSINVNALNQELKEFQYLIRCVKNGYLDHDSYVDCSRLYSFKRETILNELKQNPGQHLGSVYSDDLTRIVDMVKVSPVIAPIDLKKFNLFE